MNFLLNSHRLRINKIITLLRHKNLSHTTNVTNSLQISKLYFFAIKLSKKISVVLCAFFVDLSEIIKKTTCVLLFTNFH